jgi:hypothetical protein
MFFNKNLDQIRIEESDLLIHVNFNNPKKIPIKEIKKVYVSVKKIPFHYELAYVLFGGIFIGLNFGFYPIGMYFWIVCGLYLLGEYVLHNFKTCTLNVELQNENIAFRFIPIELKYQVVNKVNEIKFSVARSS